MYLEDISEHTVVNETSSSLLESTTKRRDSLLRLMKVFQSTMCLSSAVDV